MTERCALADAEDIGIEKGKRDAALAIAANALKSGQPIEAICSLTGLTADDVRALNA